MIVETETCPARGLRSVFKSFNLILDRAKDRSFHELHGTYEAYGLEYLVVCHRFIGAWGSW